MTEKMLKDALQEVKLSDEKKRQILKKVKMQKGQKVSYGRRKKLAIATVGFACVICVGFFYSLDHLTMENPSGEKEGLQMSTTGENTSTNDLEEENEENVVEEQIVWKVQGINKKEVVLSKCEEVGVATESGNTIYEAEEEKQTYVFSKDCLFILSNEEDVFELTRSNKRHNSEVSKKEFCEYMSKELSFWSKEDATICTPLVHITMKEGEIVRIQELYVA